VELLCLSPSNKKWLGGGLGLPCISLPLMPGLGLPLCHPVAISLLDQEDRREPLESPSSGLLLSSPSSCEFLEGRVEGLVLVEEGIALLLMGVTSGVDMAYADLDVDLPWYDVIGLCVCAGGQHTEDSREGERLGGYVYCNLLAVASAGRGFS
jgi:hypothetical protein